MERKTRKTWNIILAIMWTFVLVIDVILWVCGATPQWLAVFCPLIAVVVNTWIDAYIS